MKVLIGAAAAMALLTLAAAAQPAATTATTAAPEVEVPPSRCQGMPRAPTFPDGATASDRAVVAANEAYQAWAVALRAVAECRRAEFEDYANQRRARADAHDALNTRLREVSERWADQRNLYCARPRRQCRTITEADVTAPQIEQSGPCAETLSAPEPTIPDGETANQEAMDAADAAYLAWGREAQLNLRCRRAEFDRLSATVSARGDEHNALAQRLAEVTAAWEAERTEFCARPRKQCEYTDEQQ